MNIAFVASEVYPFIKTGGLADVAGALPKALAKLGHDVRVICPKYRQLKYEYLPYLNEVASVYILDYHFRIEEAWYEGIRYYFIDQISLFHRDTIYESDDRDAQFSLFCEVVLKMLPDVSFCPDVIHCNDWQTGLIPFFLTQRYGHQPFYERITTLYTIHNLRFQGQFNANSIKSLGYHYESDDVNFMKLGILYATKVSTVSQTYAQEILTDYFGENLNEILCQRRDDLFGIVNGIDETVFHPERDIYLPQHYTYDTLHLKSTNKVALQKQFGLNVNQNVPLIGLVTRLDSQKGLDLLQAVIEELLLNAHVQVFLLGSGEKEYEQYFQMIRDTYCDQFGLYIGYNESLARLVYGASDFFLMPSRYEPCGLSQLISLKYGTIPIVRETGGLNDTIKAFNEYTYEGNGFTFKNYNAHDMLYTIRRAITYYHNHEDVCQLLRQRGMSADYSWDQQARQYEVVYQNLMP